MKQGRNSALRLWAMGIAVLVVVSLSASGIAQADLITFKFEGVVESAERPVNPPITPNTSFKGSYSFESTAPDQAPETSILGRYALSGLSVDLLGKHYSMDTTGQGQNSIEVIYIPPTVHDYHVQTQMVGDSINDLAPTGFFIGLGGLSIGDDSLPQMPPSLGGLTTNAVKMDFFTRGRGEGSVFGRLTDLTLAPVPLPGALVLFGSGLFGLAGLEVRRRLVVRRSGASPESRS